MLREQIMLRDFYGRVAEPVQVVALIMSATSCAIIQPDGQNVRVYQSTTQVTEIDFGHIVKVLQLNLAHDDISYASLIYDKINPESNMIEEYRYGWLVVWDFIDDDNTLANRQRTLNLLAILVAMILYESNQPPSANDVVLPTHPSNN